MTHEVGYGVEETPPRLFSEVAGIQDPGLLGSIYPQGRRTNAGDSSNLHC